MDNLPHFTDMVEQNITNVFILRYSISTMKLNCTFYSSLSIKHKKSMHMLGQFVQNVNKIVPISQLKAFDAHEK